MKQTFLRILALVGAVSEVVSMALLAVFFGTQNTTVLAIATVTAAFGILVWLGFYIVRKQKEASAAKLIDDDSNGDSNDDTNGDSNGDNNDDSNDDSNGDSQAEQAQADSTAQATAPSEE